MKEKEIKAMAALDPKGFSQVGFIVKDIDEARENFAKLFGCEVPPAIPCGSPAAKTVYKGEPAPDAKSKLAFFNLVPSPMRRCPHGENI